MQGLCQSRKKRRNFGLFCEISADLESVHYKRSPHQCPCQSYSLSHRVDEDYNTVEVASSYGKEPCSTLPSAWVSTSLHVYNFSSTEALSRFVHHPTPNFTQ